MNTFELHTFNRHHIKGKSSKAAKQAFRDIRADKDMRVREDSLGIERKVGMILTEQILEEL